MLDFGQELVDQYALAMSAAGLTDRHIGGTRAIVIEFARSLSTPLWEATCADADAFLAQQRRMGLSVSTRAGKSGALSGFYDRSPTRILINVDFPEPRSPTRPTTSPCSREVSAPVRTRTRYRGNHRLRR